MGRSSLIAAIVVLSLGADSASALTEVPPTGFPSTDAVREADGSIVTIESQRPCAVKDATHCTSGFAMVRRRPDATLDPGFGVGGRSASSFGEGVVARPVSVAIDNQGRIVVAGRYVRPGVALSAEDVTLARYLPDGRLDPSFGLGGLQVIDLAEGSIDFVSGVLIQPDDKIVVGALASRAGGSDFAVARFDSNGGLDPGFGQNGVALASPHSNINAGVGGLALQSDGKILVAGNEVEGFTYRLAVLRLMSDGSADPSFGRQGFVTANPVSTSWGSGDEGDSVLVDEAGNIIVTGTQRGGEHSPIDPVLLRLDPTGTPDPGFTSEGEEPGIVTLSHTTLLSVAPLAGGDLFLGGVLGGRLRIARLGTDGRPRFHYNAAGRGLTSVAGLATVSRAFFPEPDGGALALVNVSGAHCRASDQKSGWRLCRAAAIVAFDSKGRLRRGFGGVGFKTSPPIHYCRALPTLRCGIDLQAEDLHDLAENGRPRKAHLRGGRLVYPVRCDRRVETRCRVHTDVRIGPHGDWLSSGTVVLRAGTKRLVSSSGSSQVAKRLDASPTHELSLPLRQTVVANGLRVRFSAKLRVVSHSRASTPPS